MSQLNVAIDTKHKIHAMNVFIRGITLFIGKSGSVKMLVIYLNSTKSTTVLLIIILFRNIVCLLCLQLIEI